MDRFLNKAITFTIVHILIQNYTILLLSNYVSAEIYCVIPNNDTNTTCPETCLHCDTLSQYAAQPDDYFASNTSLVLLNGNHELDRRLSIANIEVLYLYPNITTPYHDTTVMCTNTGAFTFENIGNVQIGWLNFSSCAGNEINSVNTIVLDECSFNGQGPNAMFSHGITFSSVTSAKIIRSSFVSYHTSLSAILFKSNQESPHDHLVITLKVYTFSNNRRSMDVVEGSAHFYDSYFVNNTATGPSTGGGICFSDFSNIVISNCTFINNSAEFGGAVGGSNENGTVLIENSSFLNNSASSASGAVYIESSYNSYITVNNSVFFGNRAGSVGAMYIEEGILAIHNSVFIGNSAKDMCGALDIDSIHGIRIGLISVSIKNCTFVRNSVPVHSEKDHFVDSKGGAVCVKYGYHLELVDSSFVNNSADIGGALYVTGTASAFDGEVIFINNSGANGGAIFLEHIDLIIYGSLYIHNNKADTSVVHALSSSLTVPLYSSVIITDNVGFFYAFSGTIKIDGYLEVSENSFGGAGSSTVGGSLTMYQSEVNFSGNINIERNIAVNGGGILATESKVDFYGQVTIASNTALQSGGGIYAYQSELNFAEEVNITDNEASENGGGIHVISSTAKVVGGFLYIANNRAQNGGGMSLQLNSKLYIIKSDSEEEWRNRDTYLKLEFSNNIADYGGALYVFDDTTSGGCALISSANPQVANECFFQSIALYSGNNVLPDDLNILNTFLYNNTATTTGSSLYGGLLDRCRVSPFAEFFLKYKDFNSTAFTDTISYIVNVTDIDFNDIQNDITSSPVRVCFCTQDGPDCGYHPPPFEVTKGKAFKVRLVAVDQVNTSVDATIHASLSATNGGFIERQTSYNISSSCTDVEYSTLSPHDSETLILYAEGPCKDIGVSSAPLHLKYKPCPIGFEDKDMKCDCDDKLLLPEFIESCSIDNETVLRKNNVWFTHKNTTDYQGYILHNHCPFSYCHPPSARVYVNLNIEDGSDAICLSNRSRKLCGSCEEGLSLVFSTSRCKLCSNRWISLISFSLTLGFIGAGTLMVFFFILLNLTISVGTICGLIFYANIFAANRNIFLPNFQTNVLTVFISWINLDFGFEVCFFDGMDGYVKTWLQFVFPLYILALVIGVIKGCEYSDKFSSFLMRRKPVETLATLIYLSYAKLLRTIIAALSPTVLEYSDGPQEIVWLFDANVPYLKGKHIPLFIAAVLVVIAGLFYTGLLFFWQWIDQCSRTIPSRLSDFMRAYHAPYNKHHRYWIGLLPLVTAILYLISAANVFGDPCVNLLSINTLIVGLLFWQTVVANFGRGDEKTIYKNRLASILENSFFLNLIALTSVTYFITSDSETQYQIAVSYTSIAIAFVTFIGILIYHVWTFNKKPLQQGWNRLMSFCGTTRKTTERNDLRETINVDEDHNIVLTQALAPSETVIDRNIYSPLSSLRSTLTLSSQEGRGRASDLYSYGSLDTREETSQHDSA